jgi:hypothetical protein
MEAHCSRIVSDPTGIPLAGTSERDLKRESRRNKRLRFGSFRLRLPESGWLQEYAFGVLNEAETLVGNRVGETGVR